jgi:hypothetical protein
MTQNIFTRQSILKPSAMKTVAERRFGDAAQLRSTGNNARANGVAYLAGFVIEILLKAKLVEKFSQIAKKRQHKVTDDEREIWLLIWKRHDLEDMLSQMAELEASLKKRGELDNDDYHGQLKKLCATWTIQARYSSQSMLMNEAGEILDRVQKLKELLK